MATSRERTGEHVQQIQKCINDTLVPLMQSRKATDGVAWRTSRDLAACMVHYPLIDQYDAKPIWHRVELIVGSVEQRSEIWRESAYWREMVEANGGVDNDEVAKAVESKFPHIRVSVLRAAASQRATKAEQRAAGPSVHPQHPALPSIPGLEDAQVVLREIETLEKRASVLREKITQAEADLANVMRQLEAYKPMQHALRVLKDASDKVRAAVRQGQTT